jgi:ABC-type proline/glycine betaine transport system ATPase subunit
LIKDETALISFEGVSFSFPNDKILFEDLNLKFKRGAFYLIQGSSGAGKSTLLRLITRLDEPTAGEILFKDKRLSSYHPPMLRRSILYIQQTPTAIDASTRENLLLPFGLKNNRDLKRPDDSHLRELLSNFILEDVEKETLLNGFPKAQIHSGQRENLYNFRLTLDFCRWQWVQFHISIQPGPGRSTHNDLSAELLVEILQP